jgi:hypothetical protein
MSRRKSAPLKPQAVVTTIVVCAAVCLAGIGYVWAKSQVWTLGREMKALEVRRDDLKRANDALSRKYAGMCTPRELELRVKQLNLGLAQPRPDQFVRLAEPATLARKKAEGKLYASQRGED